MKSLVCKFLVVGCFLFLQFAPFQNLNPINADAYADESQEMAESAPAIMQAAYEGDWQKVVAMAKKNKSQLKEKDDMGWTVLHQAASSGDDKVIEELLRLGADKNARDNTGKNGDRPYDLAKNNKKISQKVLNMLK